MPVMKFDPYTGKPLMKEGELPRPPIEPKVERSPEEGPKTPIVQITDPELKVNPFVPDNRPNIQPLVADLNKILKEVEDTLKARTAAFKVKNQVIPKGFEYKPTITRVVAQEGTAFKLNKPEESLKPVGSNSLRDYVFDRVLLEPSDIVDLLKNENVALGAFLNLVNQMYDNLVIVKQLDINKQYVGTCVATLSRPGQPDKLCSEYMEEQIEIRLFSDVIAESDVKDVVERRNSSVGEQSQGSETIALGFNQ